MRWIIGFYISPFQSSPSGLDEPEDFEVPLAAAPRLDHLSGDDVHEDFGERAAFGIAFEVVGGFVPRKAGVEHHRQEQVVAVVDDDQLAAGALQGGVVDEVFLRAVRADVALERELAGDDLFDRDLLVPAVAAVAFFAARLGDLLGAAQRAPGLDDSFSGHASIVLRQSWPLRPVMPLERAIARPMALAISTAHACGCASRDRAPARTARRRTASPCGAR